MMDPARSDDICHHITDMKALADADEHSPENLLMAQRFDLTDSVHAPG